MKNKGLFSTLFIEDIREEVELDDSGQGRMATLAQKWHTRDESSTEKLWDSFLKQAISYLQFVPPPKPTAPNVYPLFEDYSFTHQVAVLYFAAPQAEMDDVTVGQFWPGKLVAELKKRNLNWGILTNGAKWRLYSLKTAKPYEDFVELDLVSAISDSDEKEYALFERFFHRDSFVKEEEAKDKDEKSEPGETEGTSDNESSKTETNKDAASLYKCRLDTDAERSEEVLEELVKAPLLSQVDEILQYVCNGFIADTERTGPEYTEEERREIFESAVKLLYRALFLFYAEARSLLPSEPDKAEEYRKHSIQYLCEESHKFRWNQRRDTDGYDLWKHLKGLVNAVNDGDPEYGIMGYNGGLFDDQQEKFLGKHKLRNDFLARALYLLAYVEPWDNDPDKEYAIPYEDLEVRHLGELYENILEFNVTLADADRIRRRTKKGVELLLASNGKSQPGDTRIKKGDVFFGETALERKQTGSYYTPEALVQFLNQKAVMNPLRERFEKEYRKRFNEFYRDAQGGRDTSTRRGAAQSAIALVERFVQEVVLKFKTCDPGMGSGHFLVNAANQISDLIVELISEIPHVEGLKSKTTCAPNFWRRLVTRHCVYGVDLNPLAVHLAKLSLWLNCFAQDHQLTFLDHHLKCGNSLVGIRTLDQLEKIPERAKEKKLKNEQQLLFSMDLKKAYQRAVGEIQEIEKMDEDATDKMKELLDDVQEKSRGVGALADLYTVYLMNYSIEEDNYREIFSDLARGDKPRSILATKVQDAIRNLKVRHHFFHWAIEFPDVFHEKAHGFDAATGNPPWDVVSPNSIEFFLAYDSAFRGYEKQKANAVIEKLKKDNPIVSEKWDQYWNGVEEERQYYRGGDAYHCQGKGDFNTFKLFLERFFALLKDDGLMCIITPSSLYTDQGCLPLRKMFFDESKIRLLYCFENRWPTVFSAVDGRFKFILFCTAKGGKTDSFKCAFMQHDPRRLPEIDRSAIMISMSQIKEFSPQTLSIPEFSSTKEEVLATKMYRDKPSLLRFLSANWDTNFQREFHMTGDSHLFVKNTDRPVDSIIPLVEGKQLWILTNRFCEPIRWMKKSDVSRKPTAAKTRIAYRALAAATNERTFISTVLPGGYPTGHTVNICPLPPDHAVVIASIFSSMSWDWLVRSKVTTSISIFVLEQLPFPDYLKSTTVSPNVFDALLARGCRLICIDEDFAPVWQSSFSDNWKSPSFWYPASGDMDYGPAHERDIRARLANSAKSLIKQFTPACGVHESLPDRRDTGDRAQLRAEIDAYVAHLYGLSRDDFAYILDTFPVLKKKELQAFGEFRSKRKCLEEYDRAGKVMGKR